MTPTDPTRRRFLQTASTAVGGAWLAMHMPAIRAATLYAQEAVGAGQAFETLTSDQARVLEAIASRFYPTDDTPGATEIGVVHFMDRALGTFWSWFLDPLQGGLAGLDEKVGIDHADASDFSDLSSAQQDELLTWWSEEHPTAFFAVTMLVAGGMFGHPDYGGNQDGAGWELIGFEQRNVWEPPFGHYDQEYRENGEGDR